MSDFKAKCTKFAFCWGSTPDATGGAYSAPQDPIGLSVFKGPTSKRREEKRRGWEMGSEGKVKGR